MNITFLIGALAALFAIMDPFAIVPAYISLTQGIRKKTKLLIIKRATLTAIVILIIFSLTGHLIFSLLGFTLNAFRIAGGILLFTVGFQMMYGKRPGTKYHNVHSQEDPIEQEEIGVVPIGIPLLAGPGAITTMMILVSEESVGYLEKGIVMLLMVFVVSVAYMSMRYADRIFDKIGRIGATALSRIMGLIVAAIAVQFIIDGIMGVISDYGLL
jgi:multiple antibiotic resistance protein